MSKKFFQREELVGKLVIDQEAIIVGKIEDLAITENGKMGLMIKREGEDVLIDLDDIQKIKDVVLLKPKEKVEEEPIPEEPTPEISTIAAEPEPEPVKEVKTNVCPNCGHENKPTSKFCVKCGTVLG